MTTSFGIGASRLQQRNEFEKYPLIQLDPTTGKEVRQNPATGDLVTYDPVKARAEPWYGSLIKGLAIGGVGAGFGAAGLAALGGGGSGVLGGLGLGGADAGGLASPIAAQGGGFALGSDGIPALVTGSAAGGGLGAAAPYLAGGAVLGGGAALAAGAGGGGSATDIPNSVDITSSPAGFNAAGSSDPFSTANLVKYGILGLGGASLLSGGLGGLGTQTTTQNLSPQQLAYQQIQQQIAEKQLQLLNSQGDFQGSYLDSIRPLLDQQSKLMQQQYDAFQTAQNDPLNKQLQQQASDLLGQQISSQNSLAPLQQQLLEAQLKQAISGGNATPEQLAAIDAATKAAYDTGTSDINAFASDSLNKLGQELAPGLGLRPTDTPIQDRAALVAREATRQAGQLTSNLAGVNANARINLPLAQQQIGNATASNTANIASAAQKFQADLAQQAITNRLNLLGAGRSATDLGLTSGSNLVSASRGNPLTYGGSTTTSNPSAGLSSTLGGLGGLLTGLNSVGLGFA